MALKWWHSKQIEDISTTSFRFPLFFSFFGSFIVCALLVCLLWLLFLDSLFSCSLSKPRQRNTPIKCNKLATSHITLCLMLPKTTAIAYGGSSDAVLFFYHFYPSLLLWFGFTSKYLCLAAHSFVHDWWSQLLSVALPCTPSLFLVVEFQFWILCEDYYFSRFSIHSHAIFIPLSDTWDSMSLSSLHGERHVRYWNFMTHNGLVRSVISKG